MVPVLLSTDEETEAWRRRETDLEVHQTGALALGH